MKRIFLIVLDSFGIGNAPDAADFGDKGSDTLRAVAQSKAFCVPNLQKLGLFQIEGTPGPKEGNAAGAFGRMTPGGEPDFEWRERRWASYRPSR